MKSKAPPPNFVTLKASKDQPWHPCASPDAWLVMNGEKVVCSIPHDQANAAASEVEARAIAAAGEYIKEVPPQLDPHVTNE